MRSSLSCALRVNKSIFQFSFSRISTADCSHRTGQTAGATHALPTFSEAVRATSQRTLYLAGLSYN